MNHDDIMDKYMSDLDVIAQESAFLNAARVPQGTRKLSGQAQASTRLGVNRTDLSVTLAAVYAPNAIPNSIELSVQKMREAAKGITAGDTVYVSNDLPYIRVLEFTRGDLMFSKAAAMWQTDVDRAVSNLN